MFSNRLILDEIVRSLESWRDGFGWESIPLDHETVIANKTWKNGQSMGNKKINKKNIR